MLRLAKAFWDIALWRRTPAQLPASTFLLALVCIAAALLEVVSAFLPPVSSDRILTRMVLSIAVPLGFVWAVLAVARRPQRFLQTASAFLGVGVLVEIALYPIGSLIHIIGSERLAAVPLGVLMLTIFIWYWLACSNIWRAALDSGFSLGAVVSVGYIVLSIVLEQQLLPDT